MRDDSLVRKLKSLGLREREIPVYEALLKVEYAKASELSKVTGIHRPTVYALLDDLIDRGYVISSRGKVRYFSAVSPEAAFKKDMDRREEELTESKVALKELTSLYDQRKGSLNKTEGIEVMSLNHVDIVFEWLKATRRRLLSVHRSATPRKGPLLEQSRELDAIEIELLSRNVESRCLYSDAVLKDPYEFERMKKLVKEGEQARSHPDLPMILVIIDDDKAMFTLYVRKDAYTTYLVTDPSLIVMLIHSFERLWEQGSKISIDNSIG